MSVDPVDELDLEGADDVEVAVNTARWYSQAARDMNDADGVAETAQRIAELGGQTIGADLSLLIGVPRPGGIPDLLAATDFAAARELIALQQVAGESPAWHAIVNRSTVQVDDLAADDRWAAHGTEVVSALSLRTVLAFCLLIDDQPLASLALYSRNPAGFSSEQVELAAAFADHAAIALSEAAQAERITNLEVALEHARDIGAAIGIIMALGKITQSEAFDRLRRASQHHNRKLYELALEVVRTGDIPG